MSGTTRPIHINEGYAVTLVAAGQATSSGDTAILAAVAATRRRIIRIEASNSHSSNAITVGIKNASLNGGSTFGKRYLPAVGGLAIWTFPGGYALTGVNEAININLSGAGQIEWTLYYKNIGV